MKKIVVSLVILSCITSLMGCESAQTKERRRLEALSKLTCESSKENRTHEELVAIGDACFRSGSFVKSSGKKW
jgi:hypothetical protein